MPSSRITTAQNIRNFMDLEGPGSGGAEAGGAIITLKERIKMQRRDD